jgi:hypothetical protein
MSNLWKTFRELRRNSTKSQTQPSIPEPTLDSAVREPDDEGLSSNLVEMQQNMIVQLHQDMYNMAQNLREKDELLVEKEREVEILREASVSDNFEVEYWRCVHDEQQEKFRALYFHTSN